jgi:DNA (cytosine-5)-methyltransferase 1
VRKIGRGGTRIWLEGLWLLRSGFEAFGEATVMFDRDRRRVVLVLDPEIADTLSSSASTEKVRKKVSGKIRREKEIPVIDIERKDLSEIFGGAESVIVQSQRGQLVITPSQAEVMREERLAAKSNNHEISLYSGAGFLSLAAERAGLRPVLAIEKWDRAADAFFAAHRRRVRVLELGVEEVALGEQADPGRFDLPRNPWLLTAGVPCETYSVLGGKGVAVWGKPSKKRGEPERPAQQIEPHFLADQIFWTLLMVLATNPINVVVENVVGFTKYAGGFVRALQVLGYHVNVGLVDPNEHGYVSGRRRSVIVATTHPGFSFPTKRTGMRRGQSVKALLLNPNAPVLYELGMNEGGWFSIKEGERKYKAWVRAGKPMTGKKLHKDYSGLDEGMFNWLQGKNSKGEKKAGFAPTVFEYSSERIPAVTKSMHKGNPTGPYVHHPRKRDLYRMLTTEEIARIHGVPPDVAKRIEAGAGGGWGLVTQLYGQGVHVPIFEEILKRLPKHAITVSHRRLKNPVPVVPLYYGHGPLYSTLPWGWM